jgi:hypothetical protein
MIVNFGDGDSDGDSAFSSGPRDGLCIYVSLRRS